MKVKKELTIKCLLAALSNLTASSPPNKADFCKVEGGLGYLISILSLKTNNDTGNDNNGKSLPLYHSLQIIEAAGCILRNISSFLVTREDYREILRQQKMIPLLLEHLESPSLNVVSNACVILANLSASSTEKSNQDQMTMLESNALKKLANLKNSKHKIIREGAIATYRHLINSPSYLFYSSYENRKLSASLSYSSFPMRKMKIIRNNIASNLSNDNNERIDSGNAETMVVNANLLQANNSMILSTNLSSTNKLEEQMRFSRSTSHDSIEQTAKKSPNVFITNPENQLMTISANIVSSSKQLIFGNDTSLYLTMDATKSLFPASMASPKSASIVGNCDSNDNSSEVSSQYDIFCGDAKCQNFTNNNKSSTVTTVATKRASLVNELDDDYTTDYSERYKEKNLNDNKNVLPVNRQSAIGEDPEDSIKVYETEGTPLMFSLSSSLQDINNSENNLDKKSDQIQPLLGNVIAFVIYFLNLI